MPAAQLTDADLVERCRAGETAAWDELVERYSRYVLAIARGHRLADADAEDVFQDVFARAYTRLDRLRDPEALRPWIGQLARRAAVDKLRARREEPTDVVPEPAVLDAELERLDAALDVRAALATLSDPCREVLDRFFTRDQSYDQISRELGLPAGTIASRISRCLARLRQVLEDEGSHAGAQPS